MVKLFLYPNNGVVSDNGRSKFKIDFKRFFESSVWDHGMYFVDLKSCRARDPYNASGRHTLFTQDPGGWWPRYNVGWMTFPSITGKHAIIYPGDMKIRSGREILERMLLKQDRIV